MNLEDFPMDEQRCPVTIESCEYSLFAFYLLGCVLTH